MKIDRKRAVPAAFAACSFAFGASPAAAQHLHDDTGVAIENHDHAAAEMNAAHTMLEDPFNRLVRFDRLEARDGGSGTALAWDFTAWAGHNTNKLWIRSEGERESGHTDEAELEVLWAHSFARWWDFVAGARHDFRPDPDDTWAAFGVQGLAPYRLELEATAFVADGGRAAMRVKTHYDLLITNRVVLQGLLEANWYSQSDPERGVGSGLADAELGLRVRYELRREIAPYLGLVRHKRFGATADFARAAQREADDTELVAGLRFWF
jgi:copper resistance protein B